MQFQVIKENLYKALMITGRNINSRPQLPILSNILIKAKENKLQIASTNLELGIIFTIPAKIEKEGEITVSGKIFVDFISNLSGDKIDFILEGTNLLVKTTNTNASFTTVSAHDFPSFPEVPAITNTFPLSSLKSAIQHTVFAASADEGRPVLTGVRTYVNEGNMVLSATDGYRLSKDAINIADKKASLQLILSARTLFEVLRITEDLKAEELEFCQIQDKNQVVFKLPQVLIFSRIIEGEFPQVDKIIPTTFKTKVVIDRDAFTNSVKTASLFAKGAANIIKIKIEKNGLRLKANTPQVGEEEEFVEAKISGEEGEIAFNFRFLLDYLNNVTEKETIFEMSGPLNPGVFKPNNSKSSFLHIIMPVRIQN